MTILEEWRRTSPNFNESHEQWADTVKRFVEKEIAPNIDAWEEAGELPRELHKKAAEVGILGLGFPEEYGGVDEGIDRFHGMVTAHEMAQVGAGGLLAGLMVHAVGLAPVLTLGDAAIKKRIAPDVLSGDKLISLAVTETSGGSDVSQLHTRGELKGDHYVVNGSKTFITGGMRSDYFTVAVRTAGEGPQGISLLLLEADMPGVERTVLKKMGWHCSDTATLYFDNVKVPVENRIGPDGGAFLAMMTNFNGERLGIASTATAFSTVCLEEALDWARERETFGKKLVSRQVIQHKFAEMLRKIYACLAWVDRAAVAFDQGHDNGGELALLKVQATRTMEFCAREAAQVMGGASFMKGCRVERIYREVRANAISGGSEEIMLELAARQFGLTR
jgi:acyl-CoA dehydrogenase